MQNFHYMDQQLTLEITKKQVEAVIKEQKSKIYYEFKYFDFEDVVRQTINDKIRVLNSSIKSLREAKSKNDKAIKEQIEASKKSCDKVKKDLDKVQQR